MPARLKPFRQEHRYHAGFLEIRKILLKESDLREQLQELKERIGEHDVQLSQVYDPMENMLDEKAAERKWEERERIGFNRK